jgi:cytidylate kinase
MNVITIDGPAGSGKTAVASLVARRVGLPCVPSGNLFRAVAWKLLHDNCDVFNQAEVIRHIPTIVIDLTTDEHVLVDTTDVTDQLSQTIYGETAARIGQISEVRNHILAMQRALGDTRGCVIEGRSTGTEVFPEAVLKVWLTARPEIRLQRIMLSRGAEAAEAMLARDNADATRKLAPMQKAPNAIAIDASDMTVDEVVEAIVRLYQER